MSKLLIGATGFVGGNLKDQISFDDEVSSSNISDAYNKSYEYVYCAAPQAAKWLANNDPKWDKSQVDDLIRSIKLMSFSNFILISTVDVYENLFNVDEDYKFSSKIIHHYGMNRRYLEHTLRDYLKEKLFIVRLPALVGKGLKKNIIYDLMNNNEIHKIDLNSTFQWYNIKFLSKDIERQLNLNIPLLNISSEPLKTKELVNQFFKNYSINSFSTSNNIATSYNIKSKYSQLWNSVGDYLYSSSNILENHIKPFILNK